MDAPLRRNLEVTNLVSPGKFQSQAGCMRPCDYLHDYPLCPTETFQSQAGCMRPCDVAKLRGDATTQGYFNPRRDVCALATQVDNQSMIVIIVNFNPRRDGCALATASPIAP